jgi:hypothetical protein
MFAGGKEAHRQRSSEGGKKGDKKASGQRHSDAANLRAVAAQEVSVERISEQGRERAARAWSAAGVGRALAAAAEARRRGPGKRACNPVVPFEAGSGGGQGTRRPPSAEDGRMAARQMYTSRGECARVA